MSFGRIVTIQSEKYHAIRTAEIYGMENGVTSFFPKFYKWLFYKIFRQRAEILHNGHFDQILVKMMTL